jgi:tRNA (guanine-N7-)-methyltransferase
MRLRNVKNKEIIINSSNSFIEDPKSYKGKWSKLFHNDNPIYIEIGMGKGKFIIENAKKYKDINFIGIEMFDSVLARALERLDEKLPNLWMIRLDANEIDEVFDHEIDKIYLNFSDPWPKKRHEKRRLTSNNFLVRYKDIFADVNKIIMKTDNRKLFEYSLMEFVNYDYKIDFLSLDLYNDEVEDNVPTEYEMKFHSKGFPIYKVEVSKKV